MNTELETTYVTDIRQLAVELTLTGAGIQGSLVTYANTAREIGLKLQSWCGHEQINFKFFEARCANLPFDFDRARRFVRIALAMPKPAKTVEDVRAIPSTWARRIAAPERGFWKVRARAGNAPSPHVVY